LSGNPNLSGHMPSFSIATSLETLNIEWTNFSNVKSSYFSNFTALTELGLDRKIISRDFLSSDGMLASLNNLVLTRLDLPRESELIFSWFEGIRNLRSLDFSDCDLSMTIPSSIGNFKNLTSLAIHGSNLTTQTLSAIANIRNLKILTIYYCGSLVGQLPPAIGNMTSLERLEILECQLSGPIPQEVGAVKKLTLLVLLLTGLSGRIPSSIGNLTQLTVLSLGTNYLSEKFQHHFSPFQRYNTWIFHRTNFLEKFQHHFSPFQRYKTWIFHRTNFLVLYMNPMGYLQA